MNESHNVQFKIKPKKVLKLYNKMNYLKDTATRH